MDKIARAHKTNKQFVLYHASSNTNIKVFEPRAEQYRHKDEGPVVFATPDKAYASCFLVKTDDSWVKIGRFNINGKQYPWHVVISDRKKFVDLDKGGAIYHLPSDTFFTNSSLGAGVFEWTSTKSVVPITKDVFLSGLMAMIAEGVQVYFVDMETFGSIKKSVDHGQAIISKLKPFNIN